MKTKLIATALFAFTATAVIAYPMYQGKTSITQTTIPVIDQPVITPAQQKASIEVVFALDTTGSMGGLIQAAKEKIWSIATTMASAQPAPEIKMGLVAYRDRGDAYVTKVLDLSSDLDSMYATLMDFKAQGGGDGPESVNQALDDAINKMSWSQNKNTYKVVFLVGDAPPHMDYQDDVKYPVTLTHAKQKGIVVNAIQCGANPRTTNRWQKIAHLGDGDYFQVAQAGNAVAISTPYDKKMATLSRKLDATRLYYGSKEQKAKQRKKVAAAEKLHAKSSVESRARRAEFNTSKSGMSNMLGENELVDDVVSGRVDVSKIERDKLPEPMQSMSADEQKRLLESKAKQRQELQKQIKQLSQQRKAYIEKEVKEKGGAKDSLDDKLYSTVREQAGKKGLRYEAAAPAY